LGETKVGTPEAELRDKQTNKESDQTMYSLAEMQKTYKTLKMILSDEDTFHHVVVEIFQAIDVTSDGGLDKDEIINFIKKICIEMGLA
jgi:hypothetical protein